MKCDYCFTDAGDQTCKSCGNSACNRHVDENGICPVAHDVPVQEEQKEEETQEESPRPKRHSSRTKPRS